MKKMKKAIMSVMAVMLTAAQSVAFASCGNETADSGSEKKTSVMEENGAPLGIYTDLQFVLNGENATVKASVKNKFTLFPSTVTVNLELYRSQKYEDNVSAMTLFASNYIYDLDQGETLTAKASTDGRKSYWKAKASYKVDNKSWKQEYSETVFLDENGIKATPDAPAPDDREYYISDFLQDYTKTEAYISVSPPQDEEKPWWIGPQITYYRSDNEFNEIKKLFGEIKLSPYNGSFVETQLKNNLPAFWGLVPFRISAKFEDGSKVNLCIDDRNQDFWGANLFVEYWKDENGETLFDKCFTATVSDKTEQALIEFTTSIYWDTYYQNKN